MKRKSALSNELWLELNQEMRNFEDSAYNLLYWLCIPYVERTGEIVGYINGAKREVVKKIKVFQEKVVQFLIKGKTDYRYPKKTIQDIVEMISKVERWRVDFEDLSVFTQKRR